MQECDGRVRLRSAVGLPFQLCACVGAQGLPQPTLPLSLRGKMFRPTDPGSKVRLPVQGSHTKIVEVRFGTRAELTKVWVGLSRLASIKHPHITQISPEFLYYDTPMKEGSEPAADVGGVICVSVEPGLIPLDKAVDLSLLQCRVEQAPIPPPGCKF